MKLTTEQINIIRQMNRDYLLRCEMMWEDILGEIEMRFNLEPDEVYELLDEID